MKRTVKRTRMDTAVDPPVAMLMSEEEMRNKMKSFMERVTNDVQEFGSQVKLANDIQSKHSQALAQVERRLEEKTEEHERMGAMLIACNRKQSEQTAKIANLERECEQHIQDRQDIVEDLDACRRELQISKEVCRDVSQERTNLSRQLDATRTELNICRQELHISNEAFRVVSLQRTDLEQQLDTTREELRVANEKEQNTVKILDDARENFTDCITLQQKACSILLTSGSMLNFEGLLQIWLNDNLFNGDIWFPFRCPVTSKTTTPVRELGKLHSNCFRGARLIKVFTASLDFISRLGSTLELGLVPALFFQYKPFSFASDNQGEWLMYNIQEQLQIFSKLVLAFHRRNDRVSPGARVWPVRSLTQWSQDASFSVAVKSNHIISVNARRFEESDFEFSVTLNVISTEGVAEQHAVELSLTADVERNPFPGVQFVYPEPPVMLI